MNINLITGATGFLASNLIYKLLKKDELVWVIVRGSDTDSAAERMKKKFPRDFEKIKVIEGDILFENLNLSEKVILELKNKKIRFWHLAANLSFATKDKDLVWKTNFNGTKNVVNLANKIDVDKFIYVSTAYVSGDYEGEIFEDQLIIGQKFRNNYEHSKYEAEKYVRENIKNTFLIFRPSIIIGEVYSGKADGCTFGYYRFSYMFYLLKLWAIKKLNGNGYFWKFILKLFGTKYDNKKDEIYFPWMYMMYVKGGVVDLISVDFVADSMIKIGLIDNQKNETIHLTNNNPADAEFLMRLIFKSLGYKKVKHLQVSKWFYLSVIKIFYILTFPIKNYTKSVYWYLPYFIRKYNFSHKNSEKYNLKNNTELNELYMNKVNNYAREDVFKTIDDPKL